MITLRGYQEDAVRAVLNSQHRRSILVAPGGCGKTVTAAAIARQLGCRTLFLAHRKELIDQAFNKLTDAGMHCGVIRADDPRRDPNALVQVASVPTLIRRGGAPLADLVILDECHHANAETFAKVLGWYPEARHLGLTFTPYRLDGQGLGALGYSEIIVGGDVVEMIEAGWLVQPRYFGASKLPSLAGVPIIGGDYNQRSLADAVDRPQLVADVVRTWQKLAEGRTTVVFAVDIAHSEHLMAQFEKVGVDIAHLDGTTPEGEREDALKDLADGKLRVITNCNLIAEGWDLPRVSCVILARPTQSRALYRQQVARGLRPWSDKGDCLVLDHAGNALRHGFVEEREDYVLEGRVVRRSDAPPVKQCPECFAYIPAALKECPECGHEFKVEAKHIVTREGELVEIKPWAARMTPDERVEVLRRWIRTQVSAGYRPGWVAYRYRQMFGEWPPSDLMARATRVERTPGNVYHDFLTTARTRGYNEGWAAHRFKAIFGRWPTWNERKRLP